MVDTKLARIIEVARGHTTPDVLFSCGEFTAAEVLEYWPQVVVFNWTDPLRQGAVH